MKVSGIGGIVGFKTVNEELKRLIFDSFETAIFRKDNPRFKKIKRTQAELIEEIKNSSLPSYRKKIEIDTIKRFYPNGKIFYELQPYEINKSLWSRICEECSPTVRLFVWFANQEPRQILYILTLQEGNRWKLQG